MDGIAVLCLSQSHYLLWLALIVIGLFLYITLTVVISENSSNEWYRCLAVAITLSSLIGLDCWQRPDKTLVTNRNRNRNTNLVRLYLLWVAPIVGRDPIQIVLETQHKANLGLFTWLLWTWTNPFLSWCWCWCFLKI